MLKKAFYCFLLCVAIIASGCNGTFGIFGHSSNQVDKQNNRITAVQDRLDANADKKIYQVQDLSFGTGYALSTATNTEPAIEVAKELNSRVETIVGLPALDQQKAIMEMVGNLVSNNIAGQYELKQKDKVIAAIQSEEKLLLAKKDKELDKALELSKSIALQNDSTKAQLDQMNSFMGLGAVWYGLKHFVTRLLWWITGLGVLFFILRLLSSLNPIASAVFGIFEAIGASIIHAIGLIVPRAISQVKSIEEATLEKVVDSIQYAKEISKPDVATVQAALASTLTDKEKAVIAEVKKQLNY